MKKAGIIIAILCGLFAYYLFEKRYYYTQYHGFEPFTQIACPKYDSLVISDSTIVVLCLGGSTTNDLRLNEQERYPSILQKKLELLFPQKKLIVLNGGRDWYTSKHSLINYTTYYRKFNPDIVIVMHTINDVCRSFSPKEFAIGNYSEDYAHYYGPSINGANPPVFENYLLRKTLGDFKYQQRTLSLKETDIPFDKFLSFNSYMFYLSSLIRQVKQDGSVCLVVEEPSFYLDSMSEKQQSMLWFGRSLCNNKGKEYPNYHSMKRAMQTYNHVADSITQKNMALFVKTDSLIPKTEAYFKDDVHHTPLATERLAQIISEKMTIFFK